MGSFPSCFLFVNKLYWNEYICVCVLKTSVYLYVCVFMCMWRSEDKLPWDQTQDVRLRSRLLYPLKYLTGSWMFILYANISGIYFQTHKFWKQYIRGYRNLLEKIVKLSSRMFWHIHSPGVCYTCFAYRMLIHRNIEVEYSYQRAVGALEDYHNNIGQINENCIALGL